MYDELVKRLRDAAKLIEALAVLLPHSEGSAVSKMYNEAADAIEELSRENESLAKSVNEASEILRKRWIPVTEALPEGDNRILVCSKLRDGQYWQSVCRFANNLHEVDEYDFPNERRPGFYYYDDEYGWIEKTGVTYWMPLPSTEGLNET